jgi:hypothetical protein
MGNWQFLATAQIWSNIYELIPVTPGFTLSPTPVAGERPYTCDVCNKSFPHSASLKGGFCWICFTHFTQEHINTHIGEKPFACQKCDKTFAQSSNLRRHQKVHTGEKPYVCNSCGKAFSQSTNLKQVNLLDRDCWHFLALDNPRKAKTIVSYLKNLLVFIVEIQRELIYRVNESLLFCKRTYFTRCFSWILLIVALFKNCSLDKLLTFCQVFRLW